MKRLYTLLIVALLFSSCEDILDVVPEDVLLPEEALQTEADYQKLLISCYDVMANTWHGRSQYVSELISDNLVQPETGEHLRELWSRDANFFNGEVNGYYSEPYILIYRTNSLLSEAPKNTSLSASFVTRIEAEAKFLRAFCYFDLVRKFAQPFGYTTDNSHLGVVLRSEPSVDPQARATVAEVYDLIISDLDFAINNLPESNGVYVNRYGALGMKAKVAFHMNDRDAAVDLASQVINSGLFSLDPIDRYNQSLSSEHVFGIVSSDVDRRSGEFSGKYSTNGQPTLSPTQELYDLAKADTNDTRGAYYEILNAGQSNQVFGYNRWNGDWFNVPLVHLTELKLIRAEALAEANEDLTTAIGDINDILDRAYGGVVSYQLSDAAPAAIILETVRREKRFETFGEGERLYDLKRRGVNGENIIVRGAPWDCPGSVLQFPSSEQTNNFVSNPEGGC